MLCRKPYVNRDSLPFGCGQCLPCRLNKRRLWAHRIMLEACGHSFNWFVTLTYAEDHLPAGASLVPRHTQLWLKRLRKVTGTRSLRYFLVGEYGDRTQRPHYHAALFGSVPLSMKLLEESWSLGHVMIGILTKESAGYVAGYVVKKMTGKEDVRLKGRHPEFVRMSRRPGIGFNSVAAVCGAVRPLRSFSNGIVGVPSVLMHGCRCLPLGRYLRGKIRESLYGENAEASKLGESSSYRREMQELFRVEVAKPENASRSLSSIVEARDHQRVLTMEGLFDIHRQRRTL